MSRGRHGTGTVFRKILSSRDRVPEFLSPRDISRVAPIREKLSKNILSHFIHIQCSWIRSMTKNVVRNSVRMLGNLEKAKLKGLGKGKCDEMFTFWNAQFGVRETPHSFPSIICHFELDFYFQNLKIRLFSSGRKFIRSNYLLMKIGAANGMKMTPEFASSYASVISKIRLTKI